EYNGQPAEWQTCPTGGITFPIPEGVTYTLQVKAIGPNGEEDSDPYVYNSPNAGTQQPQDQQLELYTEILGKEAVVKSISNKASLRLQFATKGANIDPAEIRCECRRETETEFRRCP